MKKSLIKSIFALVLASAILGIAQPSFASKLSDINKKRKATRAKIHRLKILETQETNKMIRNQQKLERNERALQNSQFQYDKTRGKLDVLDSFMDAKPTLGPALTYQALRFVDQLNRLFM